MATVHEGVELLEERDRLQVLPAPVAVGDPLALLAGVVQVEHRRHRVDPQPVDVELLHPVLPAGAQEVAHLVAPEVEDQRPPVGLLALAGVGVLVEGGPVEAGQGEVVLGEVRRHPVDDHPDGPGVEGVDQGPEVVGGAEARRGGEVARHLVAPRRRVGVLAHGQQLDVGEALLGHVVDELGGQLPVGQRPVALLGDPPPGAQMDLVDRQRPVQGVGGPASLQPLVVAPLVARLGHHAGRGRRQLGGEGGRVGLEPQVAVGGEDLVLVPGARTHPRQEQLPHPRGAQRAHGVEATVPAVEVAHHPHGPGRGGPHREGGAPHPLVLAHVGTEHPPEALVASLADEVLVELADGGPEPVGVVEHEGLPVGVGDLEAVGRQLGRHQLGGEHPSGVDLVHGVAGAVVQHQVHGGGVGAVAPNHRGRPAAGRGVGTEHVVGIAVLAGHQLVELGVGRLGGGRHGVASRSRWTAVRGMSIQSGRCDRS